MRRYYVDSYYPCFLIKYYKKHAYQGDVIYYTQIKTRGYWMIRGNQDIFKGIMHFLEMPK